MRSGYLKALVGLSLIVAFAAPLKKNAQEGKVIMARNTRVKILINDTEKPVNRYFRGIKLYLLP